MKELKIIIAGQAATGKSSIMLLIEQMLIEKGFEVELNLKNELFDYGSEKKMRRLLNENLNERLNNLNQKVKITLETKQLHIDFTKNSETQAEND